MESNYVFSLQSGDNYSNLYTASRSKVTTLYGLYTTPELLNPAGFSYADDWGAPGEANSDISEDEWCASMQKARYRFRAKFTAGQRFEIPYVVHFAASDGYYTNWSAKIEGIGTGQFAYYPTEGPIEFLPPYHAIVSGGCTSYIGARKWITLGCAANSGSCAAGGCITAVGGAAVQNTEAGLNIKANVGVWNNGDASGSLVIAAAAPDAAITSPAGLAYFGSLSNAHLITISGQLRQVKSPSVLADITTLTSTKYKIQFHNDSGALHEGSQLYATNGPLISTITIEQVGSADHVRVTVNNGSSSVHDYEWSSAAQGWKLTSGGGLRIEAFAWTAGTLTSTHTISNSAGKVAFQESRQYRDLTDYGRVLSQHTVGPGGPALLTQWSYCDNPSTDGTNYGRVKMIVEPSGFWRRFEYDTQGRLYREISQFLNSPTNAVDSECRVVEYNYSPVATDCSSERRVETLLGAEVSRQFMLNYGPEVRSIRCVTPGATNPFDAGNLVTITKYCPDPENAGKVWTVKNPDGTVQVHTYGWSGSNPTTTIASGVADATGTNIVDGTSTTSTHGLSGEVLSVHTSDIASTRPVSVENYSYSDLSRRSYTLDYLNGTSTSVQYSCCGLESTTDPDGTQTTYTLDALGRQVASTRNGITASNMLDAAGHVLGAVRIAGANQLVLSQSAFDSAGQLTSQTNAFNGATLYTNRLDGLGQTVKTNTFPDGGTRVETFHQDGSLQSLTGSAVFPVRYVYGVATDGGLSRAYTAEIKLTAAGADTIERSTNFTDLVGRKYKTTYANTNAPYPESLRIYNSLGQLKSQADPDGVTTLYVYNSRGEVAQAVLDMDRDGQVDTNGTDRITETVSDVIVVGNDTIRRTRTYTWTNSSANSRTLSATTETAVNAEKSWQTASGLVTSNAVTYAPGQGERTTIQTAPDLTYTVSLSRYGTNVSMTRYDADGNPLGETTFACDSFGRQNQVTDARNGTTMYYFNAGDQVSGIVTPAPGPGQSAQVTSNFFDAMGHVWHVKLPDNTTVTSEFYPTGLLKKKTGSREYPVEYTFDAQGRMKTMTTWQNYPNQSAVTTWNYHPYRGWLDNKRHADNQGPNYTYTAAGRLKTRAWARSITTTYGYNYAGDLETIDYSDATPDVSYGFDRQGRQTTITQGGTIVTSRAYALGGALLSESYSGGPLSGLSVTNGYDQYLRRTNVVLLGFGSSLLASTTNSFDVAGRMKTVGSGSASATYSYLANSPLVEQIAFANNGAQRMVTTKQYDFLNRLQSISSVPSASSVVGFAYDYNSANQRTLRRETDGAYWRYEYDSLGQVTSGKKFWSDGTPVAGQQFDYSLDTIGNRKSASAGGDKYGTGLRRSDYSVNSLNQYTNRTVPGFANVVGTANASATVSLWGDNGAYSPTTRKEEYFRGELGVNNSTGAVWLSITNVAVLKSGNTDIITNIIGKALLAKTPQSFYYDLDGNLTNDGTWTFTWDGENRLVQVESSTTTPQAAMRKVVWQFDGAGRRVRQTTYDGSSGTYTVVEDLKFLSDDWRHIAELNATNNAVVRSYVWGLDLSGSLDGAGGVGGLLTVQTVEFGMTSLACFDGNGNLMALVSAADGTLNAQYEYSPFGEPLRTSGPIAASNPFQFSTKRRDSSTGLLLYEYRPYSPERGRWITRDPLEETGGVALFGFAKNSPVDSYDVLGMCTCDLGDDDLPPGRRVDPTPPVISIELEPVAKLTDAQSAGVECAKNLAARSPENAGGAAASTPSRASRKCVSRCNTERQRLLKESETIKALMRKFGGKDCKAPRIICKGDCSGSQGGGIDPNRRNRILICVHDDMDLLNLEERIVHELVHALQLCNKAVRNDNRDCRTRLRMEVEAYYCANQQSTFDGIRTGVLFSSCQPGVCTAQQVESLWDEMRDWFNKNKERLCRFNDPEFPRPIGL